jgi:DNA gyrase subunit B
MSSPPQPPEQNPPAAYTYETIQVLSTVEDIRRRPGMYIGDTGIEGLHYLLMEGVVRIALDQMLLDRCRLVSLSLLADGGSRFEFDCGKPLGRLPTLNDLRELRIPRIGLHGVGISAAIALASRFDLEVIHDGTIRRQEFRQGRAIGETTVARTNEVDRTILSFWPDPAIFQSNPAFDSERIAKRWRELSALFPDTELRLMDHRTPPREQIFSFPGGLPDYVQYLNRGRQPIHPNIFYTESSDGMPSCTRFQLAMQWTESEDEQVVSLVKTDPTDSGTHLTGLRRGILQAIRRLGPVHGIGERDKLLGADCREGLTAIIAVYLPNPQFGTGNRSRLSNPEVENPIAELVAESLALFLDAHDLDAAGIYRRIRSSFQARVEHEEQRRQRRNQPRRRPPRQR